MPSQPPVPRKDARAHGPHEMSCHFSELHLECQWLIYPKPCSWPQPLQLCLSTLSSRKPSALEREGRGKQQESWVPTTRGHVTRRRSGPASLDVSPSGLQATSFPHGYSLLALRGLLFSYLFDFLSFSIKSQLWPQLQTAPSVPAAITRTLF